MKKLFKRKAIFLALVIFLLPVFLFGGCKSTSFISKFSKNINEYNIVASIDCEQKNLEIKQTTKYINNSENNLNEVHFHIYPKAFSEGVVNKPVSTLNEQKAYNNGVNYGNVEINLVKVNNEEVTPEYKNADNDILVVRLSNELLPKSSVEIYFEYTLTLPNINHRYGYGENTINLGNFYLISSVYENDKGWFDNSYHYNGDPFYSEMSNYNVKVNVSKNYTLASTGKIKKIIEQDDENVYEIQALAVRDFALILSDKFIKLSSNYNNINVNYFYYSDSTPNTSLQACIDSLKTYINLFGEYPYTELNVCESNFVYGGMEYPNIVFISDNLDNYEDYIYTIAHEIAHQWWYGLVGNNEYNFGFLDEGLTEYSTYLFFEENPQYNMDTNEMIKNTTNSYLLFLDVYKEVFSSVDTSMLRSLDEYNTEPEYIYMSYVKGTLMFENLRELIGKNNFINSLKYYYKQNRGKNATPENLIEAFNHATLKNLEPYFNSWLNGNVVIETL